MDYFEKRRRELYGYYNKSYNDEYIDDIITEGFENDYYDDEYVYEGVGDVIDSIKSKVDAGIKKIKELWQKFKNWIKNIFNVIVNMFKSGEKLVKDHRSDIEDAYKTKKNAIKFNGHLYTLRNIDPFLNGFGDGDQIIKGEYDNVEEAIIRQITDGEAKNREECMKFVAGLIKSPEKKEHKLAEIPLDDLLDVAGNGKTLIKDIKVLEKEMDSEFKNCIDELKSARGEDEKVDKEINKLIKTIKTTSSLSSSIIKKIISTVKEGIRLYTSLIRKLLDNRIKGKDDDNVPGQTANVKDDGPKKYVEDQKEKINNGGKTISEDEELKQKVDEFNSRRIKRN